MAMCVIKKAMVELHSVEAFSDAAKRMYLHDPSRVRFSLKYRPCDRQGAAKVTDGSICLTVKVRRLEDMSCIQTLAGDVLLGMSQWGPETVDDDVALVLSKPPKAKKVEEGPKKGEEKKKKRG